MKQPAETIQTIANLTIDRHHKTVTVDGKKVPTLSREYLLIDELAQTEGPVNLIKLGRSAFANSELTTDSAVLAIAYSLRTKLTSYGARRGLVHVDGKKITMFRSPETVQIQAFHVPSANWTPGPADGTVTPEKALCELTWAGEIPETDDGTVLEQVWHLLNVDDRPNRRFAPALSVADIVTLMPGTAESISYQVDRIGWIQLKGRIEAASDEVAMLERQLEVTPASR
ncbi:MAG: hypothetical protein J0H98_07280 [Solirubrobacterales bacterium]|nr:hypothetical protein [Solirubrobacterales bacterium]